ncbi:hypothetical protein D3C87_2060460 [compost metagenome]
MRVSHERDPIIAETFQDLINYAFRLQKDGGDADDHDPGEEVGQIHNGLNNAFDFAVGNLIEHDGQEDRSGKDEYNLRKRDV